MTRAGSTWSDGLFVRRGLGDARDALIGDITPLELRGRAFGFNKAMDKRGGFFGRIVAAAVLYLTQRDTRSPWRAKVTNGSCFLRCYPVWRLSR